MKQFKHNTRIRWARVMLLTGLASSPLIHAQECVESIRLTSPTHRFTLQADGTALDAVTGLQWQRCPLGFDLDDNGTPLLGTDDRCRSTQAENLYTWQEGLQAVASHNSAGGVGGHMDWRMPNNTELESIVERQCVNPAINLAVFPAAGVSRAWSSTISIGGSFGVGLNFAVGDMTSFQFRRDFGDTNNVRLVRSP